MGTVYKIYCDESRQNGKNISLWAVSGLKKITAGISLMSFTIDVLGTLECCLRT